MSNISNTNSIKEADANITNSSINRLQNTSPSTIPNTIPNTTQNQTSSGNSTINSFKTNLKIYQNYYNTYSNDFTQLKNNLNIQYQDLNKLLSTNLSQYTTLYKNLLGHKESYDNIVNGITDNLDKIKTIITYLTVLKKESGKRVNTILNDYLDLEELYDELSIGLDNYWKNIVLSFTQQLYKNLFTVYITKFKTDINKINLTKLKGNKSTNDLTILTQYKTDISTIKTYLVNLQNFWALGSGDVPLNNALSQDYINNILKNFTIQLNNIESSIEEILFNTKKGLENNVKGDIITLTSSINQLLIKLKGYLGNLKNISTNSEIKTIISNLDKKIQDFEDKGTTVSQANKNEISKISGIIDKTSDMKSTLITQIQTIINSIQTELNSTSNKSIINPNQKVNNVVPNQRVNNNTVPKQKVNNVVPEQRVNNNTVPKQKVNNVVPNQRVNNTVPNQRVNNTIPEQRVNNVVPEQRVNNVVPNQKVNNVVPNQRVNNTIPEQRVNNVVPEQRVNNAVPNQKVNNVVPNQRVNNTIPEQRVNNVVPEQRVNNAVPEQRVNNMDSNQSSNKTLNYGYTPDKGNRITYSPNQNNPSQTMAGKVTKVSGKGNKAKITTNKGHTISRKQIKGWNGSQKPKIKI